MEQSVKNELKPPIWRMWIDNAQRIVSFHEMEGCRMLEFRSKDLFQSCIDQYMVQQYRYQ